MRKTPEQFPTLSNENKLKRQNFFQSNEISRSIYSCSIIARKVIALASSLVEMKVRKLELNKQSIELPVWIARFSISDFLRKFEISDCGKNYENIKKALLECQNAKIILEKDNAFKTFSWFYSVEMNQNQDFIELTFSPDVGLAIYNFKSGYTSMRFKMISCFKSIYTFRFYEIAVSFKGNKGKNGNENGKWFFNYTIEELKKLFNIKQEAYLNRLDNFITRVIKKPIEELNKVNNEFVIEFNKIKDSRKTVGFRFECTEIVKQLKIAKTDSPELKQEKQKINEDWTKEALWKKMQEKYPEVWAKYFEQEKHNGFFVFDEVAANIVYEKMLSEGFSF